MRECLDEGILQSYFDGELSASAAKTVVSHLADCEPCAVAARELQSEINLLATALAPEFEAAVPTERLRQRIDAAIAGRRVEVAASASAPFSLRGWFQSLVAPLSFTPQRAFGYSGLVLVLGFAAIMGITWRNSPSVGVEQTAVNVTPASTTAAPPVTKDHPGTITTETVTPAAAITPTAETSRPKAPRAQYSASNKTVTPRATEASDDKVKLLPGERSYLQTIAKLDSTIKASSNRPMRPALQAEYERNLALVDRALAATRNAAKKNPNDPDAAEFMMAAYENKVNLLNAVAEARSFNRQQD